MTDALWYTPKGQPLLHEQKGYSHLFYFVQVEENIAYIAYIYSYPDTFDIHIKIFNINKMVQTVKGLIMQGLKT